MVSHDSRRTHRRVKSVTSLLCILAASLGANDVVVDAFGIASTPAATAKKSKSALEISTVIPHHAPTQPSLAARLLEEVSSAVQPKRKQKKVQRRATRKSSRPTTVATVDSNDVLPLELDDEEVLRRKLEWAGRYTSVEALRETFGSNENKLWGDMQACTARRLYKTLLPRALLELSQLGVGQLQPQDLAPLAYQARVAAKMYARERCTVPARIGATLFDGFRQWSKYGKFQANGMTYDQLWEKYSEKICQETESEHPEEDVCLKILERSCVSNEGVDNLVLKDSDECLEKQQQRLLERIHAQLEQDMYELLLPPQKELKEDTTSANVPKHRQERHRPWSKRNHVMVVRLLARQRRMQQRQQQQREQDVLKP